MNTPNDPKPGSAVVVANPLQQCAAVVVKLLNDIAAAQNCVDATAARERLRTIEREGWNDLTRFLMSLPANQPAAAAAKGQQ